MAQKSKADLVSWAKAYPFDVPKRSFIYVAGQGYDVTSLSGGGWQSADVVGGEAALPLVDLMRERGVSADEHEAPRYAVIASGSNASPARLAQKFGEKLQGAVIPTMRVTLQNYCVVYSAKFCAYGSVPATLAAAPGAEVKVFVNLLTEEQLSIMDATEDLGVEYERPRLENAHVILEDGSQMHQAFAYISNFGCFAPEGNPLSLDSIEGENVPFETHDQTSVQAVAHGLFETKGHLDDFIHENITDPDLRQVRNRHLKRHHSVPAG